MKSKIQLALLLAGTAAIGGLTPVLLKNTKATSLEKTAATMPTHNVEITRFDIIGSYFSNDGTKFNYSSYTAFAQLKNSGNYCLLEPLITERTYNGEDYLFDGVIRSSGDGQFYLGLKHTSRFYYRSETIESKIYTPNLSNLHVVKLYMHNDNKVVFNRIGYEDYYDLDYDSEENSWTYSSKRESFADGLSDLYFNYDTTENMNKHLKIKKIVLTYDCESLS